MLKEFKEFAVKGNMFDMAVGIIIGAAFGTVVKSLVADVFTPIIGYFMGGLDFSNLFVTLGEGQFTTIEAAKEAGIGTINYGLFINNIISFVIVAWVLFIMVKAMNKMKRAQEEEAAAAPAEPPKQEVLLGEIRDLLKKS